MCLLIFFLVSIDTYAVVLGIRQLGGKSLKFTIVVLPLKEVALLIIFTVRESIDGVSDCRDRANRPKLGERPDSSI